MKELFKKEAYQTLTKRGKIEFLVLSLLLVALTVASGFAFFANLRQICNILGAIVCAAPYQAKVHFIHDLPNLIGLFGVLYFTILVYRIIKSVDEKHRNLLIKKGAITLILFGGLTVLTLMIGYMTNEYRFVDGYPTPLYPLDLLLMGLLFVALGIVLLAIYPKQKWIKELPYFGVKYSTFRKVVCTTFGIIYSAFIFFSVVGILSPLFMLDYSRGGALFVVALVLTFFSILLGAGCYIFVYLRLKDEYKKNYQILATIILFVIDVVAVVFYFVSVSQNPNVSCDVANQLLVIDFTASTNAYPFLFGLALFVPLIDSLIRLIVNKMKSK